MRDHLVMRGRGAVIGVGEIPPTRTTDGENPLSLMAKAGLAAIEGSGLEIGDIDGVLVHPIGGVSMLTPSMNRHSKSPFRPRAAAA